jgi:hypothetical protein
MGAPAAGASVVAELGRRDEDARVRGAAGQQRVTHRHGAVEDEVLTQLAIARAVAVRDALLARGAPNARVFVAAPKLCDDACASGWRPHVELSLAAH